MKIIDAFTFYNEIELLQYRLAILNNIIDHFVIVEATTSFAGHPKELFFQNNKHLFSKYQDKIVHVIVDDLPYKQPDINIEKNEQWENEYFQRECISRGVDQLNLSDEDLIIIADADEIPDPRTLSKIKNGEIVVNVAVLEQHYYCFNLNNRADDIWHHVKITCYKRLKELSPQKIRYLWHQPRIPKGGWHLSYFGDSEYVKNKIINFSHQEFNNSKFTDLNYIKDRIDNNLSLFYEGKCPQISIIDNPYPPYQYGKYLKQYIHC